MIGTNERGRTRRVVASVVAAGVLAFAGSAPARSQAQDGACRITGGYAAVFHDVLLTDGAFGYRGVIILRTRSCGDGPKGVDGVFTPLAGAGSPAKCTPVETPRIDESRCTFEGIPGVGGLPGVPVVVSATAHTTGVNNDHVHDDDTVEKLLESRVQPGAEIKTSECVLQLPEDGGRFACTLF
jgi:hypothetical protein